MYACLPASACMCVCVCACVHMRRVVNWCVLLQLYLTQWSGGRAQTERHTPPTTNMELDTVANYFFLSPHYHTPSAAQTTHQQHTYTQCGGWIAEKRIFMTGGGCASLPNTPAAVVVGIGLHCSIKLIYSPTTKAGKVCVLFSVRTQAVPPLSRVCSFTVDSFHSNCSW